MIGSPSHDDKKLAEKPIKEGEIKVKNAFKLMLESQKGEASRSITPRSQHRKRRLMPASGQKSVRDWLEKKY